MRIVSESTAPPKMVETAAVALRPQSRAPSTECNDDKAAGELDGLPAPLDHVVRYMEAHFAEPLSLAELARMCRLSTFRFATVFRQRLGIPPHRYLCRLRVWHARALLRQGTPPIVAALESGFFDQSHFSRHFKRLCGTTPGRYAAGFH